MTVSSRGLLYNCMWGKSLVGIHGFTQHQLANELEVRHNVITTRDRGEAVSSENLNSSNGLMAATHKSQHF